MSSNHERRQSRWDRALDPASAQPRIVGALLLLFAAVKLRTYLADGLPIFFDAHSHLARTWMAHEAIANGDFPSWSNAWYGGYRLLEFYSPVYYWVTAGIGFVTSHVMAATKVSLWLGQIAAIGTFFWFLRRVTTSAMFAAFGAAVFLFSAQRAVVLGSIGNHPSVFLYVGVPLLLAACHALAHGRIDLPRFVGLHSLILAGLIGVHASNLLAILPSLLVCEIGLIRGGFAQRGETQLGGRTAVMALGASIIAALGAASFFIIPMLLDLDQVSLSLAVGTPNAFGTAALESVFGFANHDVDRPFAHDQGAIWWLLSGAAAVLSLSKRHASWRPFAAGLIACLLSIALLGERAALALIVFIAPLSAFALERVRDELAARGLPRADLAVPGLALLALCFSPQPRGEHDPHYLPVDTLALYESLPEPVNPSRTFDVTDTTISVDGFYGWSSFSPYYSGRAIPFGAFPQGAPLAHHVSMALASQIVRDLTQSPATLSEASADLLYLLNVEFLVDRGLLPGEPATPGVPLAKSRLARAKIDRAIGAPRRPGVLQLRHASPLVFAPRIEALTREPSAETSAGEPVLVARLREHWAADPLGTHPDPSLDILRRTGAKRDATLLAPYVAAMRLDRTMARADLLYLGEREATQIPQPTPVPPSGRREFVVSSHVESPRRVEVSAKSTEAGFARLAYSYDAKQRVTLDGMPVSHYPDPLGTGVIVAFPAGAHTLAIDAPSPLDLLPWLGASLMVGLTLSALALLPRGTEPASRAPAD